jgi:hypothetical protein
LSDAIALLSDVSNKSKFIVASWIEELPGQAGMRVYVAVNKEKYTSESEVMSRVHNGLERIFAILSRPVDGES